MTLLQEFKTFALRGNAIDLAIGVVIGAAFNNVVTSLVNNIIMPPVGLLMGGIDFTHLALPLGGKSILTYGLFVQALINFLIVAIALFVIIRFLNRISHALPHQQPAATPAKKSDELLVLEDIRSILAKEPAVSDKTVE
ncbi:MAG: hypothetical protein B7X04_00135 [Parcubacteria group bacterium 21-54-25]|nr:MAG: hypothetical protein B7X04_00135 [Parcubacteria group bacterium 21-54-25]HQU07534.1 large conductance mechanosensitive channel protein MscL [Candidatus Paceibacterota bacterium]